jgi:peptidoglycan hydrolase CwlO-like protein
MIDVRVLLALIGSLLTLTIFLLGTAFKLGHVAARVEELEKWRTGIRADMHEISDKIDKLGNQITSLTTMLEERTERRVEHR